MVFYKLFLAPLNIMYVVNIFPSHQMVFENLVFNSCVSIALCLNLSIFFLMSILIASSILVV